MKRMMTILATGGVLMVGATGLALGSGSHSTGGAEEGHTEGAGTMPGMGVMPGSVEEMREMHKEHEHGHDFEVMEELSPGQLSRMMSLAATSARR